MDILVTAMEKFHWDNTEISNYMKKELDTRFGCSWHVVTGEEFGFDVDFEVKDFITGLKASFHQFKYIWPLTNKFVILCCI